MEITLNGKRESLEDSITVGELIARMNLAPIRVAVEVNENLVPRQSFPNTPIHGGDRVEIVTFVGGG